MAKRQDPTAKAFANYVKSAANRAGYGINSSSGDGKSKLAEAADMSEADISKVLAGEYEVPKDLLKPLATALRVEQKELLRAAGVLEGRAEQNHPTLTIQLAAQWLGIKSQQNVAAFETIVKALQDTEKRR